MLKLWIIGTGYASLQGFCPTKYNEINGLILRGEGIGTTVDFIEIYSKRGEGL